MKFSSELRFDHMNALAIQAVKRGASSRDFLERLLLDFHFTLL